MANKRNSESASTDAATATTEGSNRSKRRASSESTEPVDQNPTAPALKEESASRLLGDPFDSEVARARWPHRYDTNRSTEFVQAKYHFLWAEVDGEMYILDEDSYVKAEEGKESYICKIVEFFEAVDGKQLFCAQWYYRADDTVIKTCANLIKSNKLFFSEVKDDNPLDCLVKKVRVMHLPLKVDNTLMSKLITTYDYFCDKMYLLPYTSFVNLPSETESPTNSDESDSTVSSDIEANSIPHVFPEIERQCGERTLLDMYSGCGAMSTGLCLGANSCGVKLVTSLKLNHPETQVRNEKADDFYNLLVEWEKLCISYISSENKDASSEPIRWKGYGSEYDTSCPEKLKEFVVRGYKYRILPLPGTVDVVCGGPPCQGISGFNRFRNKDAPLEDPKNKQLVVFMDIVSHLKPKFVLMENVVDLVKFAGGFLGRYAMCCLVGMGYQARMGMMAAGAYGLPQFRMRVFLWGALPTEKLPSYPLPTHNVVVRGVTPLEFEANMVAYEEGRKLDLKKALVLGYAISDLPRVENDEGRDEMPYDLEPQTEFQRFIRLRRDEMPGYLNVKSEVIEHPLCDHCPLLLNQDDYERVCQIPKMKGANFRDLPGVRVRPDHKVEWDPDVERKKVSSGKPLVPDYAMSFVNGSSSKPFGRLWWDETVPTVVTRAEPHNQAVLHPNQDRVLSVRENARLQGFPDYYKLVGPIKERYIQVGNAVAVPVARALGFSLALALRGLSQNEAVMTLPEDYPMMKDVSSPNIDMI
ncbi:hypothetical protein SASPL_101377 [Salvia splendens]|uniref:DNA (cytosine-5-)-methyltransferase n=1 Tax=Salvia splendens TaxID=180675 RepID=A0A8X8YTV3_SALSN|nr:hypothetical protein SASPL_101377 [Salvia splendens]